MDVWNRTERISLSVPPRLGPVVLGPVLRGRLVPTLCGCCPQCGCFPDSSTISTFLKWLKESSESLGRELLAIWVQKDPPCRASGSYSCPETARKGSILCLLLQERNASVNLSRDFPGRRLLLLKLRWRKPQTFPNPPEQVFEGEVSQLKNFPCKVAKNQLRGFPHLISNPAGECWVAGSTSVFLYTSQACSGFAQVPLVISTKSLRTLYGQWQKISKVLVNVSHSSPPPTPFPLPLSREGWWTVPIWQMERLRTRWYQTFWPRPVTESTVSILSLECPLPRATLKSECEQACSPKRIFGELCINHLTTDSL